VNNHALKPGVSPDVVSPAEHEQLYREIIDTAQEGIWIANERGEITFANQRLAAMLGYPIEELLRQPAARFFAGNLNANEKAERHLLRKDGSSFWALVDSRRIAGAGGELRGMRASVVDITARRTAQEQLLYRESQLLDAQGEVSSLGRLASAVAQEFNVLLTGVQPFIDVMGRAADGDRIRSAAAHVVDAVARGKRITHDVLKFTRLVEPSPRVLNAATWMRNVEADVAHVAGARVIVRSDIPSDLRMLADPNQLAEVFWNIAANARDAMPRGGALTIAALRETHARPAPDPAREFVHFALRDTGSGIAPGHLPHIFEPLFTTKKPGATGFGLSIAQQIVLRHHGDIYAESTPGVGTTMHVLIPAAD